MATAMLTSKATAHWACQLFVAAGGEGTSPRARLGAADRLSRSSFNSRAGLLSPKRVFTSHKVTSSGRWYGRSLVVVSSAAGAAAGQPADDENPYEVLNVNPLLGFDAVAAAKRRQVTEAENAGDTARVERLERAYDRIVVAQLNKRASGVAYGGLSVSDDIKYADKGQLFPWRPRVHKVSNKEFLILLGALAAFIVYATTSQEPGYQLVPLLLVAALVRIHMKLKQFYPWAEGDNEKKRSQNGKRMVRSLGVGFGMFFVAGVIGVLLATVLAPVIPVRVINTAIAIVMFYTVAYLR